MIIPCSGWGTCRATGRPTYTVHGPSFSIRPPDLDGFTCWWIARHGDAYTTWTYRPRQVNETA